ncbi:hypothetical protein [Mycobacterium sp. 94-17]|uniref:phage fiber-tail adaptor protein n=1 Tax=Mycobacterium sp. 94-17 TaxID=2986147 RepID=UPI002D1F0053|nr:hypothetical protein [Mycobacterium sp. 94-17]MEB4212329.1 hypothetical protein [Mycobacterium sp. 94-17]
MTIPWPYPVSTTSMRAAKLGLPYPLVPSPKQYTQGLYEVLDYENDWSDWVPNGDAIITSSWVVVAARPEAGLAALTIRDGGYTATSATVWVSGGDEGCRYDVMNLVGTQGGRVGQRCIEVRIKGYPHHRWGCLSGGGALTASVAG